VKGGTADSDPPTFTFAREGPLGHWEYWLVREDGIPRFGVRGPRRGCSPAGLSASAQNVGFIGWEPAGDFHHGWVFGGQLNEEEASIRNFGRLTDLVPGRSTFSTIRTGADIIGVESSPLHVIVNVPLSGAEPSLVADSSDGGQDLLAAAVGNTLFYDTYGLPHHIRASNDGERGQPLITPADAQAIRVLTDGTDIAWIQAYGAISDFEFERLELWSSPFATRAEDLVPRRVANLSFTNPYPDAGIGSGHVAIEEWDPVEGRTDLMVYRLADGARAKIPAFRGNGFSAVAYISPELLAVGVSVGGSPPRDISLMLVEIASLEFTGP